MLCKPDDRHDLRLVCNIHSAVWNTFYSLPAVKWSGHKLHTMDIPLWTFAVSYSFLIYPCNRKASCKPGCRRTVISVYPYCPCLYRRAAGSTKSAAGFRRGYQRILTIPPSPQDVVQMSVRLKQTRGTNENNFNWLILRTRNEEIFDTF